MGCWPLCGTWMCSFQGGGPTIKPELKRAAVCEEVGDRVEVEAKALRKLKHPSHHASPSDAPGCEPPLLRRQLDNLIHPFDCIVNAHMQDWVSVLDY
jgi:hypothetical protein